MEYHEVAHPVSVLIARLFCLVWRAADTVRPNGFDLTVDRYLKLIAHSQRDRSAGLRCQILDKAGVVSLLGVTRLSPRRNTVKAWSLGKVGFHSKWAPISV